RVSFRLPKDSNAYASWFRFDTQTAQDFLSLIQCLSCPDLPTCVSLLDEKWCQAYHPVFCFGPCQPSITCACSKMSAHPSHSFASCMPDDCQGIHSH
ncbi:hypothetical protein BGW80DRAFT_1518928, partial [Lactifluus volemus]